MTPAPLAVGPAPSAVTPSGTVRRREVALLGALGAGIIIALLLIASLGFETLSSARAYVGGEGLWSKAQKDAVYHLLRFVDAGDSLEYARYEASLAVYRGDRAARLAVLAETPDWEVVHRGFLAGRNHPDDVHGMGVFLRRYQRVSYVAEAIRIWASADSLMFRLEALGPRVRDQVRAGNLHGATRAELLDEIGTLSVSLTTLEDGFSAAIGGGARWAARLLLAAMIVTALLLLGVGAVALRSAARRLRESEEARRTIEGQLRQAQKMEAVGQLTGGIAHDFNNLLTVILSNVQLIEDRLPAADQTTRNDLGELKVAAHRGAEMIRKLLAFSRAGQYAFEPQALERVLPESIQLLRRILPASVRVDTEIDPNTPPAQTDPSAVEQMVLNLATNACDAMLGQGVLLVRLAPATMDSAFVARRRWGTVGPYAALSVTDSGTGMPPEVLDRIFEPFFTTKPPGEGSGLGMAMVYGLMKQHRGFVDVESVPGTGTTVTLYFPAASDRPQTPVPTITPPKATGGTILLVEDEPALRRAGQRLLERHGYRVLVASDGQEGLELARAHRGEITLVFSDVVMPRLSGSAMHAALIREGIILPFLFTSGYTGRELPDGVPLPQGVPLLPKPWDFHELTAAVARAIQVAPSSSLPGGT